MVNYMIDEKKIEEAANNLCDYGSIYDSENRIEGFKVGANWAISEFLKDLWHDASEEPKKGKNIVYYDGEGVYLHTWIPRTYDSINFVKETWKEFSAMNGLRSWCYISDILLKEGGEG